MLGELADAGSTTAWLQIAARWHVRLQFAVACAALAGVAFLCAIILSKKFFLGADSANHYAHVWYISDQLFHHGRLPLHVANLESGRAITFPYAIAPWALTAILFALAGDRAVTLMMVAGFVLYGYAAVRARPALRDPRLLCLIYINTFLIESLVAFQMAFVWACVFFLLYVEAVDHQRWALSSLIAVLAVTTHPFAGGAAVAAYAIYGCARRPREIVALLSALTVAGLALVPFLLYIHSAPSVASTKNNDLMATLRFIARYRGVVIALPLLVSAFAPAFRATFVVVFIAMALMFAQRIDQKQVNTFGLDRNAHPFYGQFLASSAFDPTLRYRVLEPNDREDGAYQLIRGGAVLTQEFFDQSQFRRWWNTRDQYACFLGAKGVDVVLLERDYPLKYSQNENTRLSELEAQGLARVLFREPRNRFTAYDVRGARRSRAKLSDCKL
ncbi:MAG: hypothetical protein M3P30_06645 [Chloroflexota bacterium]|nr:hypothetical protein [Chloroflexota bacterium]